MLRLIATLLVLSVFSPSLNAQKAAAENASTSQTSASSAPGRLPVKRVVLYKNGVGYFEHSARVHGSQDLNIDFTTAQLNDVLKSLTVVDLGEGRISSVRYNSIAPLDERLKALRLPFGENVTRVGYLSALRGARVEVRGGTTSVSGRLLSVETEQRTNDKTTYPATLFAVVTDSGEMRNFELGPNVAVRIADHDLGGEVGRYMDLVGSSRARDLRRMTISDQGPGDRNVFVSYISEVPVWKSTYRIILPDKTDEKPLLQGWAIVDNTVGEDWKDVQLSLIAGAPQSFVQQISQPFYVRRPTADLPQSVMPTPQSHEGTLTDLATNGRNIAEISAITPGVAAGSTGLRGNVTDVSGAAVAGARVTLRNEDSGASQSTTTDPAGNYRFYNVAPGNAALFVSSPGFKRFDLTNVYLGAGRINELNAKLEVGTTNEAVQVAAGPPPVIATESAEVTSMATKQHIEAEGGWKRKWR